jgi:hypothetical protein
MHIQFVNLKRRLTITNWHSWKICENSEHMVSFKCLALVCVIWPLEKSNTSSLRSLRIAILFWQRLSLVLLAPTMSGINDSQFLGHSRFSTWKEKTEMQLSTLWSIKIRIYKHIQHILLTDLVYECLLQYYFNLTQIWCWTVHYLRCIWYVCVKRVVSTQILR